MEYADLAEKVIGAAYDVYNNMDFGFLESVYENCLKIELEEKGLSLKQLEPIEVKYRGRAVGHFVADLIVEDTVIVELKAIKALNEAHEVQLVNYLVAIGKPVGLLINFSEKKVDVKRKVPVLESVRTEKS